MFATVEVEYDPRFGSCKWWVIGRTESGFALEVECFRTRRGAERHARKLMRAGVVQKWVAVREEEAA